MDESDDGRAIGDGGEPADDAPAEIPPEGAGEPTDGAEPDGDESPVRATVDIDDGRTVITVAGQRDAAVIVRSASGEQIYLPPEDFASGGETSTAYDSPYDASKESTSVYSPGSDAGESVYSPAGGSGGGTESVYGRGGGESHYSGSREDEFQPGLHPTTDGVRIVHPEPVTDVRIVR